MDFPTAIFLQFIKSAENRALPCNGMTMRDGPGQQVWDNDVQANRCIRFNREIDENGKK
jgi:hypothetical protein